MVVKLYIDYMSPPSRAVLYFLRAADIKYEVIHVRLEKGDHMKESFVKLTPMHAVPIIDDDGFILTECTAILKYLSAKEGVSQTWYPLDIKHRTRVDEYLAWHPMGIRAAQLEFLYNKVLFPVWMGKPTDDGKLESQILAIHEKLELMERYFLRDRPYMAGEWLTIADVSAFHEVTNLCSSGVPLAGRHPRVAAWHERVRAQLPPHDAETAGALKFLAEHGLKD